MSDDNEGMEDALSRAARDIQNRMSRCIRTAGTEDHHFHDFFCANISIVSMVWDMLVANGLQLPKASALGTLFPKRVPKAEPGVFSCQHLHGRCRPKDNEKMGVAIHQKYF